MLLYADCRVAAQVADGTQVAVDERTDYPFGDAIEFQLSLSKNTRFPLWLRVPRWCDSPALKINGENLAVKAGPLSYLVIDRPWRDGDRVSLRLPMRVAVRKWARNKDSVSVDYGPLTFSLQIGERWARCGGTDKWPDLEVYPPGITAWLT